MSGEQRAWRREQRAESMVHRAKNPNYIIGCGIFLALICLSNLFSLPVCYGKVDITISGETMGTTYHVTLVSDRTIEAGKIKQKIDHRLKQINQIFSTYDPESEISQFNQFKRANEKFKISSEFYQVMAAASIIHRLTDGAWDGTLYPLIKLWGFGPGEKVDKVPEKKHIKNNLSLVGFEKIKLYENSHLIKKNEMITLDLSSIAKGYGVDQMAELIQKNKVRDFLVEIGGEVFASGYRKGGKPWRVGVNLPVPGAPIGQVYKIVEISDQAFATSGDYRNFFKVNGRIYSHILDPKTGYPVKNGVVSVSVIADHCAFADGLATAIMVMGPKKGIELVDRLEKVECMVIVMSRGGKLVDYFSNGFLVE